MQLLITMLYYRTRDMFKIEKDKLVAELKALPFSDMKGFLKGRQLEAMAIEEVNKRMMDVVKVKSVKQLKDIYIQDESFSDHFCLKIAAKIFFVMESIS